MLALCAGCGLLVELLAKRRLPTAAGARSPASPRSSSWGSFSDPGRRDRASSPPPWWCRWPSPGSRVGPQGGAGSRSSGRAFAAAAAVLCVYAAPIVLSGEPTFAGFIKLDDTATWLVADRPDHGARPRPRRARPSTYEATLHFNLADGYPVGAFVPFGVGGRADRHGPRLADPAVHRLRGGAARARPLGAGGAAGALAVAAGGWRRSSAPSPRCSSATTSGAGSRRWSRRRSSPGSPRSRSRPRGAPRIGATVAGALLAAAALAGVLSAGGLVWLVPARRRGRDRRGVAGSARCGPAGAVVAPGGGVRGARAADDRSPARCCRRPRRRSPTPPPAATSPTRSTPAQAAGIWPAGDFRFHPDAELLAYVLIGVACAAAIAGLAWCGRRGELSPIVYVLGALASCAGARRASARPGSAARRSRPPRPRSRSRPARGLAGSPARGRRLAAAAVAAAVAGGVLWSNALGYGGASLAPRDQLARARADRRADRGAGPDADDRVRAVRRAPFPPRRRPRGHLGASPPHGPAARTASASPRASPRTPTAIDPAALAFYRTLVVRRSPAQSRPPLAYRLIWRGEYYEVWQRPPRPRRVATAAPARRPRRPVRRAALRARAARSPGAATWSRPPAARPWSSGRPAAPVPAGAPSAIEAQVRVPRGRHVRALARRLAARRRASCSVDGEPGGSRSRHELNNEGGYVRPRVARELERGVPRRSRCGSAGRTCTRAAPATRARSGRSR